jgi:hypothetical protein
MSCPQCGADDGVCECETDVRVEFDDHALLVQFLQGMHADGPAPSEVSSTGEPYAKAESPELVPVGAVVNTPSLAAGPSAPPSAWGQPGTSSEPWDIPALPGDGDHGPAPSAGGSSEPVPLVAEHGYPPAYAQEKLYAPEKPFAPDKAQEPSGRRLSARAKLGITVGAAAAALIIVALLVAIAIPKFLSVQRGTAWFTGGVPANWSPATVNNMPQDAALEAAWRTPGPDEGGVFPCLAVIRFRGVDASHETVSEWLDSVGLTMRAQGHQPHGLTLVNGAPALAATQHAGGGFANGQLAGQVATSSYAIYAQHGDGFYLIEFVSAAADFASEQPAVARVMANFVGAQA